MKPTILLLATAAFLACHLQFGEAVQCFHCSGNVTDCERIRGLVDCGEHPFCFIKMDQTADTVVQTCASAEDCRDTGFDIPGSGDEDVRFDKDEDYLLDINKVIIECCAQDSCNCAGNQCFAELGGISIQPSSLIIIAMQLLAVVLLTF